MQRALAIKISVIALLVILLLIPLTMISDKIAERNNYEDFARNSIAKSWTGSQPARNGVTTTRHRQAITPKNPWSTNAILWANISISASRVRFGTWVPTPASIAHIMRSCTISFPPSRSG